MSAGVPLVMRMSSAYEVGKTVCGWPPAAQITSYLSSQGAEEARTRHREALAELPPYALQLSRGYPAIPTVFDPQGDEA